MREMPPCAEEGAVVQGGSGAVWLKILLLAREAAVPAAVAAAARWFARPEAWLPVTCCC